VTWPFIYEHRKVVKQQKSVQPKIGCRDFLADVRSAHVDLRLTLRLPAFLKEAASVCFSCQRAVKTSHQWANQTQPF